VRRAAILVLLAGCAGCSQAAQNPGAIQCFGKATLAGNGVAQVFGGAGMVTFDCGNGAYIRQGTDVIDPPAPQPIPAPASSGSSFFMGTDGHRYWSAHPASPPRPVQAPPEPIQPKPLPPVSSPTIATPKPSSVNFKWGGDFKCTPLCANSP
jgi:hypothetical protein